MEEIEKGTMAVAPVQMPEVERARMSVRELASLSGRDALNHLLNQDHPRAVVQSMSRVDFYWLIKQIGEEDSLPLLRLASEEQWAHVLDMEIWDKDRISSDQLTTWLGRALEADPRNLVGWFYGQGELFCHYYLFRNVQVELKTAEEVLDLPDGFFTLDNIYYIKVREKEHEKIVSSLLRSMADQDYNAYQSVLLSLAGVLPAELEEELYRRRNVRLAEDGFLPFEEAVSLYSYVKPGTLASGCPTDLLDMPAEEAGPAVPMLPFSHVDRKSFLVETAGRIFEPAFLDRLRIEFAGICNQMVSADQIRITDMNVLIDTCRKAAGYLNLGLEEISGGQIQSAEDCLKIHPLVLIFQVGFSLTLELRWEAERWTVKAWFTEMGFDTGFWGEGWGGLLEGIHQKRPLHNLREGGAYRHFESIAEVHQSRHVLKQIIAIDKLLRIIHSQYPFDPKRMHWDPLSTFHTLIFTFWARTKLNLEPGFKPIPLSDVKTLFHILRKEEKTPPFRMEEYREVFIRDLIQVGEGQLGEQEKEILKETFSRLWDEFREDYARVPLPRLDERFSRLILIRSESDGVDPLH